MSRSAEDTCCGGNYILEDKWPNHDVPGIWSIEASNVRLLSAPEVFACDGCGYPVVEGKPCGYCRKINLKRGENHGDERNG